MCQFSGDFHGIKWVILEMSLNEVSKNAKTQQKRWMKGGEMAKNRGGVWRNHPQLGTNGDELDVTVPWGGESGHVAHVAFRCRHSIVSVGP